MSKIPRSDFYVFSTLTAPQSYNFWVGGGGDLPKKRHSVKIAGGANLANKQLVTPDGVVTGVSAADMELLQTHEHFKAHVQRGFVKVTKRPAEPDEVAADMKPADLSAPMTPASVAADSEKAKTVKA